MPKRPNVGNEDNGNKKLKKTAMELEQYPKVYLYRRIVQAKLFIDTNFADKIDIDSISDEAYFSKFHFIRVFKKAYNKTPHQYLTSVRINKAVQLFQTGLPVSEVRYAVGFDTLSSFSSLFKRTVGATPSAFLEAHRQRTMEISKYPLHFVPGCFAFQNGWNKK